MLSITPQHKIFICIQPCDFRKGIDALIGYCESQLNEDPFSGKIFVFRNRQLTAIKILVYDGTGFWLCQKRFSSGKLTWWPRCHTETDKITSTNLVAMINQSALSYETNSWHDVS